ncbi:hypothetical protein HZ326_14557 [Fusarium oxysporum f. sp. albedinis]|nr:hypothetical protein HZ326_14557 [Fusarium oxysporum f. sp. albedinis]
MPSQQVSCKDHPHVALTGFVDCQGGWSLAGTTGINMGFFLLSYLISGAWNPSLPRVTRLSEPHIGPPGMLMHIPHEGPAKKGYSRGRAAWHCRVKDEPTINKAC